MKVEVVTPEDYVGDVIIGDLTSRRGQVLRNQESARQRLWRSMPWCRSPICSVT